MKTIPVIITFLLVFMVALVACLENHFEGKVGDTTEWYARNALWAIVLTWCIAVIIKHCI